VWDILSYTNGVWAHAHVAKAITLARTPHSDLHSNDS